MSQSSADGGAVTASTVHAVPGAQSSAVGVSVTNASASNCSVLEDKPTIDSVNAADPPNTTPVSSDDHTVDLLSVLSRLGSDQAHLAASLADQQMQLSDIDSKLSVICSGFVHMKAMNKQTLESIVSSSSSVSFTRNTLLDAVQRIDEALGEMKRTANNYDSLQNEISRIRDDLVWSHTLFTGVTLSHLEASFSFQEGLRELARQHPARLPWDPQAPAVPGEQISSQEQQPKNPLPTQGGVTEHTPTPNTKPAPTVPTTSDETSSANKRPLAGDGGEGSLPPTKRICPAPAAPTSSSSSEGFSQKEHAYMQAWFDMTQKFETSVAEMWRTFSAVADFATAKTVQLPVRTPEAYRQQYYKFLKPLKGDQLLALTLDVKELLRKDDDEILQRMHKYVKGKMALQSGKGGAANPGSKK